MLNDARSLLSLLRTRRSGRPREMVAPGPSAAELEDILTIGARTPDHPHDDQHGATHTTSVVR